MELTELLCCPICGQGFEKTGGSLCCPARHTYDIAKGGYVNLLTGRAARHGDNAQMIAARRTFLEGGYYGILREQVAKEALRQTPQNGTVLDAGCGECYYTERVASLLAEAGRMARVFGFDVSKDAVLAGVKRKCASLFTASSYAIPVKSAAVDVVLSLFAPLATEEFARVLKAGGALIMAVPAERHLFGLKEILYDTPYLNPVADEALPGFALVEKTAVAGEITLTKREEMDALFAMTPYYYRTPQEGRERFAAQKLLQTEISFHLYTYRKEQ